MGTRVVHQVKIRLPRQLATAIDQQAAEDGLPSGTLGRTLIRRWLAEHRTDRVEIDRLVASRRPATVESFQNWQGEFLAIASMVWLAVYLRQRSSPESKPVIAPHAETGR